MTNTIDQALEYARAHPKRDGGSWAGWCESFVWRAGGFGVSFPSALAAGSASGPLNPLWSSAPRGALHYWAGVGGDGHVAFELGGGTLLMASSRVSNLGTALGTIHFTDYHLPLYRGWSMRHGSDTLAASALAGFDLNPLEPEMTPEQSRMLTAIYDAMFNGGPSMKDGNKSVSQSLAEISATVNKNVLRDINGDGVNEEISQIQDNADTNSLVRQLISRGPAGTSAPIDYVAIGAAVRNAIIKQ